MTDHVKDQLCARIDELEKEKLELNEQLDIAQRERDALAAHQADLVRELTACQSVLHQLARSGEVTPQYADDAKAVLERTKETSLTRLKAQWQRDLVTQLAEGFRQAWPEHPGKHAWILGAGDAICRQAEGVRHENHNS